ncbi:alpha/beta-hydrolase [Dacryopinax primogenitus]|uniref:Alpha/beta-hydrolase n=1 Tax=Dacryopinax primogenitus (strain DJM 731) TaxID=1858805 RepID=M5GFL1_DACPD|nr:alpha/beta-hydrolase [Dacryopinax primogenitus]EJU06417.1 alpha/beta-hydrolase [Dacryopinax primogenitus]
MPVVDVPGASLFYDSRGSGSLFLLIPGGHGTGDVYHSTAAILSSKYMVVTYDRRGFSRSILNGEQDYSIRLRTDVDDAYTLIKHLSSDGTAVVFGSSSGAIVLLYLLLKYPEAIRTLISHEPPAFDLLPDKADWIKFQQSLYDTYKTEGLHPAFDRFMDRISGGMELKFYKQREAMLTEEEKKDTSSQEAKNQIYCTAKLLLAVGTDSKDSFVYRPTKNLADNLELSVLDLPDGHVPYTYAAEPWTQALIEALEKNDV